MLFALLDIAQQRKDVQVAIGEDDVAASVELEVESVQSVGELELENTVGADLRDGGDSAGLQVLAQLGNEARGRGGGGAGIFGEMAAEARVDEQLFAVVGLVELDQEDALCCD